MSFMVSVQSICIVLIKDSAAFGLGPFRDLAWQVWISQRLRPRLSGLVLLRATRWSLFVGMSRLAVL
jgi:hypothetical protein